MGETMTCETCRWWKRIGGIDGVCHNPIMKLTDADTGEEFQSDTSAVDHCGEHTPRGADHADA